jgi:hypothetical protein
MPDPSVEVLGVYELRVTDELFREQFEILFPDVPQNGRDAAEQEIRQQLRSTALVELLVRNSDDRFSVDDFTQPDEDLQPHLWQVAYLEAYLAADGETRMDDPPDSGDIRVAFYLHYFDPARPLRTSYGDVQCPAAQPMPERLQRLVPYEPVD